ncbi:restriction endonuclease subunit S [Planktomarina temperata]|nr:restriction endonuclease subunit S [Planktomarina temperata]
MSEIVPEGWRNLLVNRVFEIGRGRVISKDEIRDNFGSYPVFSSQSTNNGKMGSIRTFDFEGEYVTWTTDGAYAGTVFYRSGKFNCTNVCGTLRDKGNFKVDMRFAAEYLSTVAKNHVSYVGNPKLMNGTFGEIEILLPPLPEQKKIASILTSVDEVIENTQKQIDKLQDLKKATMNELLTKGIGHTEFKDSELGRIPKSWDVKTIEELSSKVGSGVTPRGGSSVYQEQGVLFIRSQNVHFDGFKLNDAAYISDTIHAGMQSSKIFGGDVLLNITGASIGRCAVVADEFPESNVNQHVCIIRPINSLHNHFLSFWLSSDFGQSQIMRFQAGGNREGLNFEQIRSMSLPFPTLPEQKQIAKVVTAIQLSINEFQQKLSQTQSLKKSLMQDLLTGKVRVQVN